SSVTGVQTCALPISDRRNQEAAGEIAPQRVGDHAHAAAGLLNSRAIRAFERLIASISRAGGSTTTPPTMIQMLKPSTPNSIRYRSEERRVGKEGGWW